MDAELLLAFSAEGTSAEAAVSAARVAMAGRPLLEGPLRLDVLFFRPGGRGLSPAKLAAALETALLGIVLRQGGQFVTVRASRVAGAAGVGLEIYAA